jgi:hypothetical protein
MTIASMSTILWITTPPAALDRAPSIWYSQDRR